MSGTNNIGNDHHYTNNVGGGGAGGSGPCGACRFLRRKCVNGGCIFAPYFGSDHLGTAHFAAVHKVFGASNASKILMRIPPHKRLDAVVSLCYEALSRVSDPVYGCVSQIFTLQQQVVNLQAELAYTQARLSILRHPLLPLPRPQTPSPADLQSSTELQASDSNMSVHFDPSSQLSEQRCFQVATMSCNCTEEELKDDDLQGLARELVAKYLPGIRIRPSD